MPIATSGGSAVTSATIVDNEIVNADIDDAAAIAQSKIAAQANANADIVSFEKTVGTSHSLTTVVGQRCLVTITGLYQGIGSGSSIVGLYNGVAQVSYGVTSDNTWPNPFSMQFELAPGAATANITVTGSSSNVIITVLKFKA